MNGWVSYYLFCGAGLFAAVALMLGEWPYVLLILGLALLMSGLDRLWRNR